MSEENTQDDLKELLDEIKEEKKPNPELFKDLILEMYEDFPNILIPEERINEVIKNEIVLESLIKQEYLVKESQRHEGETKNYYSLGSNGLKLVNSWKNEKLTNKVIRLTISIITLTILMICVTVMNIVINPNAGLLAHIISLLIISGSIIVLFESYSDI